WFHYYVLAIPAFVLLLQPLLIVQRPGINFILRQIPFLLAFVVLTPVPSMLVSLDLNQQAALTAGAALVLFLSLVFPVKAQNQQPIVPGSLSSI
ncbi:MAG TPA: hypothetical protein VN516_03540, partial [Candidatus Baltobacteraceae bacterium]|nr:hypothetical protein [Candidatus Baltobacteraceae bacterium]